MKKFGYILIAAGFLAASIVSVLDEREIEHWDYFILALILGFAGVVAIRIANRAATQEEGKISANLGEISVSLQAVVASLKELEQHTDDAFRLDLHHRIDELFPTHIAMFVEAREAISHVFGLQTYADVMSEFASGERYLNRVWSAAADGYVDEAGKYLTLSREQFSRALGKFEEAQSAA